MITDWFIWVMIDISAIRGLIGNDWSKLVLIGLNGYLLVSLVTY